MRHGRRPQPAQPLDDRQRIQGTFIDQTAYDLEFLHLFLPEMREKIFKDLDIVKPRLRDPEEMLFYAVYAKDTVIYEALKKHGVTLSERRVGMLTEGGIATDGYWHEYSSGILSRSPQSTENRK